MKISRLTLALTLVFGLSACGPRETLVTILTPIPIKNPTKDLSTLLSTISNGPISGGNYCKQTEVRFGFQSGGTFQDVRVPVFTQILGPTQSLDNDTNNSGAVSAASWLNEHSYLDRPIQVPILSGQALTLGMRGVIYEPKSSNSPNTDCWSTNGTTVAPSFTLYGRREIPSVTMSSIEFAPLVIKTNPASAYSLPTVDSAGIANSSASDFKCKTSDPRTCSNIGLYKINFGYSSTAKHLIQYNLGPNAVTHNFGIGYSYDYVPRVDRFTLNFLNIATSFPFKYEVDMRTTPPTVRLELGNPVPLKACATPTGSVAYFANLPTDSSATLVASNSCPPLTVTNTSVLSIETLDQGFFP